MITFPPSDSPATFSMPMPPAAEQNAEFNNVWKLLRPATQDKIKKCKELIRLMNKGCGIKNKRCREVDRFVTINWRKVKPEQNLLDRLLDQKIEALTNIITHAGGAQLPEENRQRPDHPVGFCFVREYCHLAVDYLRKKYIHQQLESYTRYKKKDFSVNSCVQRSVQTL